MKNMKSFVARMIFLELIALLILFPAAVHATQGGPSRDIRQLVVQPAEAIPEKVVVVETNRWKPERCMWITHRRDIAESEAWLIFPFSDLFNAVCHIIVATSDTHIAYVHLTPLTSFMRTDTSELEKIMDNLAAEEPGCDRWAFHVFYFADNNREKTFRTTLRSVLVDHAVTFSEIVPDRYAGGELNLALSHEGEWFYTQKKDRFIAYDNFEQLGTFNSIPIHAIE